ncbi:MAG: SIS domain-containing protein [Candidatus Methanomethylophilaceae archaeon]|nr:SIS domain-containing protein [Candidatus Methanomethylophilaceae archaeon]
MRTQSLDYILDQVRDTVSSIDDAAQDRLIDEIVKAKKIFIYGAGRSGLVGQLFAVRLVQMGLDVHFVGDMTTPIIGSEDLAILISNTGETMSAVQTANIARRLGCFVVCVTSSAHNKLAHASNLVVEVRHHSKEDPKYAPLGTIFEDSVSLFFDSLVPSIMAKLDMNEDDMRRRHAIWV